MNSTVEKCAVGFGAVFMGGLVYATVHQNELPDMHAVAKNNSEVVGCADSLPIAEPATQVSRTLPVGCGALEQKFNTEVIFGVTGYIIPTRDEFKNQYYITDKQVANKKSDAKTIGEATGGTAAFGIIALSVWLTKRKQNVPTKAD